MSKTYRIKPSDDEISQEWVRDADEWRMIGATKFRGDDDWPWQVTVGAAEIVREEPLETELHEAVLRALHGVRGVREVHHEDRETWVVAGKPRGRALVAAAAVVVDRFAVRIQEQLDA